MTSSIKLQDGLDNNWGCQLVIAKNYSSSRSGYGDKTRSELDFAIRSSVPKFMLSSLEKSGTAANEAAVGLATNYDTSSCLFGMGSYSGGFGSLATFSSSAFEEKCQLSLPAEPSSRNEKCIHQTIALPYWIDCANHTEMEQQDLETKCLINLERRLFMSRFCGKPIKALLFEIILGGNGGELSNDFLRDLGVLLSQFNVVVIVDEVMTGGRVGPSMTLTTNCPPEFQKCVGYITMGKFTGCGLVLSKAPSKPTETEGPYRGPSTDIDLGDAFMYFTLVAEQLEIGVQTSRRNQVLKTLKLTRNKEHSWGRGCLIYGMKSCPYALQALKNRYLPLLDDQQKIEAYRAKNSSNTRSSVCELLLERANAWLKTNKELENELYPFVGHIIDYIWNTNVDRVTPKLVESSIGPEEAELVASRLRLKRMNELANVGGTCTKKAKTFILEALDSAAINAPDVFKKYRVGKKRKLVYLVQRENVGVFAGWSGSNKENENQNEDEDDTEFYV